MEGPGKSKDSGSPERGPSSGVRRIRRGSDAALLGRRPSCRRPPTHRPPKRGEEHWPSDSC
eukprot:7369610-Alexandrium_andersonii.AAC.1